MSRRSGPYGRGRIDLTRPHVSCLSFKVGYPTRDLAVDACEAQMDRGFVRPGCHIEPYACDQCGEWHTTNRRIVFKGDPGHAPPNPDRASLRPARGLRVQIGTQVHRKGESVNR